MADRTSTPLTPADKAARGLACFSLGLGALELLFAGRIARTLGLRDASTVRSYGMREITAGIAALQPKAAPAAIWGRASADALDFMTLFDNRRTATPQQQRNGRKAMAMVAILGIVDLIVASALTAQAATRTTQQSDPQPHEDENIEADGAYDEARDDAARQPPLLH